MVADSSASMPCRRLLPVAIDEIAETNPARAWASIPVSSNLQDGYKDVSFRSFADAINRAAWFLETTFGRASNSETIAYIGKSDMRYHVLSMAAAKTGYQVRRSRIVDGEPGKTQMPRAYSQITTGTGTVLVAHQQPRSTCEFAPTL